MTYFTYKNAFYEYIYILLNITASLMYVPASIVNLHSLHILYRTLLGVNMCHKAKYFSYVLQLPCI